MEQKGYNNLMYTGLTLIFVGQLVIQITYFSSYFVDGTAFSGVVLFSST